MNEALSVDRCLARLHELAWSCGDTAFRHDDGQMVWLVYAHKGDQKIMARAPGPNAAWLLALAQAERIEGGESAWRVRWDGRIR